MTTPATPQLLRMTGITKRFPGVVALRDVALELAAGEVLALMGENGAGKSTLMKVLGGAYRPDEGQVFIDGKPVQIDGVSAARKLGIALIHQELMLAGNLDVAGNIFLGNEPGLGRGPFGLARFVGRRRMRAAAAALLARVGLDVAPSTPVRRLTPGQMQMVEIAKALSLDARLIIMDEPTASLTHGESRHLFRIIDELRSAGIAIVYISHRMEEVLRVSDRITVLRDGRRVGDLATRGTTHDQVASMMVGRAFSAWFPPRPPEVTGPVVLDVKGLLVPGAPAGVSFTARKGEIVGFAGLVGSGRTELMQSLFGVTPPLGGTALLDGRAYAPRQPRDAIAAGVFLAPEDRKHHGLVLPMSITQNVSLPAVGTYRPRWLLQRRTERRVAAEQVAGLRVKCSSPAQKVVNLSGGNQQKVVLGKWLAMSPKVLIVDEPTRGVDVGAKAEIYRQIAALADAGVTVLLVSSDMEEVIGMSDRVVVMHERRVAGELPRAGLSEDAIVSLMHGPHPGRALRRLTEFAPAVPSEQTDPRPSRTPSPTMTREIGMFVALALVCMGIGLSNPTFFGPVNVNNTSIEVARLGIFAVGISAVIITGGIDLSVGSMIALTGVLIAKLTSDAEGGYGLPVGVGVAVAFAVAVLCGYLQGTLITKLGLQPFIVTLGGMLLFKGAARVLTGGGTMSFGDSPLPDVMDTTLLKVGPWTILTVPTLILLVVVVAMTYVLHMTVFGRYLYAIGGGRDAAEYSGVPVKRVETTAYVISAVLAALAGLVDTRLRAMTHNNGNAYELAAIAAAVIGGVSLRGGEGSVLGVLIGTVLFRVIYNGLNLFEYHYTNAEGPQVFKLEEKWQEVIIGTVILLAVTLDQVVHRLQARRRTRKAGGGPDPAAPPTGLDVGPPPAPAAG